MKKHVNDSKVQVEACEALRNWAKVIASPIESIALLILQLSSQQFHRVMQLVKHVSLKRLQQKLIWEWK